MRLFIQRARHGIGFSRKSRPAHPPIAVTSRIRIDTGRARSSLPPEPRKTQTPLLTWPTSNACTWLQESYQHPASIAILNSSGFSATTVSPAGSRVAVSSNLTVTVITGCPGDSRRLRAMDG